MRRKARKKHKHGKMKFILLFVVAAVILWFATIYPAGTERECITDSDCATGGCSGEICGPREEVEGIMSACIFRPEYECLKYTSCKCIQGKCQWEITKEYEECLENVLQG